MIKALVLGVVAVGWMGIPAAAPTDGSQRTETTIAQKCIPAGQCCKVCEAGIACGNSCISAKKQCHKGRGCACNASEICP